MAWEKGKSGNPGGLSPLEQRAKRMIAGLSIAAVKRLGEMIDDPDPRVAFPAAREILARSVPVPKANILAIGTSASAEHLQALVTLATRAGDRLVQPQIGDSTQSVKQPILIDAKPLESRDT